MRYLIVGDIHANLEAFQGVIRDAETRNGFDTILSLGDVVGYGPDPGLCIDLLREYEHLAVIGNHDLGSIGKLSLESFNPDAADANQWTASQLSEDHITYLAGLDLRLEVEEFTVVHGSPRDPIWEYVVSTGAAIASFMHFDTFWCIVGHSHIPFLCRPAENSAVFLEFPLDMPVALGTDRLIINPGAVGQPRDGDPRASYALYDTESGDLYHHKVDYDVQTTQEKMKNHNLPEFLINRLAEGK